MEELEHLISNFRSKVISAGSQYGPEVGNLRQRLYELGDEAVNKLTDLLQDCESEVREAVADVLEEIGSDRAMDTLVAYGLDHLKSASSASKLPGPGWVRLRTTGKKVLPALARRYHKKLPFKTRLSMIHIAHQIGGWEAWPLLETALEETDPRLVQAAAEALGRVGGDVAYQRLVQLLHADNVECRFGAICGLRLLGNPMAIEKLLNLLLKEDRSVPQWWISGSAVSLSLHRAAVQAIDTLSGKRLGGDIDRIKLWLKKHKKFFD